MTFFARLAVGIAVAATALLTAAWHADDVAMPGFIPRQAAIQQRLERQFLELPSAERLELAHRHLTDQPHPAGSARDRELAEWTRDEFRRAGLDDVAITTHEVLLPRPTHVSVELTSPRKWQASMREEPIDADEQTARERVGIDVASHAYSAAGDVTAPVVYAGDGQPADYEWLSARGIDVRGRIALVRYSVPYSYRGFKALTAQLRGAAGILMFNDPDETAAERSAVYPAGPRAPESTIERGSIAYDFFAPGDPLTPGWASSAGARRIDARDAVSLPAIVSIPLSFKDARVILDALEGPEFVPTARATSTVPRRAGVGPAVVRMHVETDDRVRPIWTVTGTIRGSDESAKAVIVGNHRDAWIYGGVDPSSGSAALIELARTLGDLHRKGWRPKRSIVFASWDGEELASTGSTEWGEEHQDWLRTHAVAYLNVDSAVSGSNLEISAVPALNDLLLDVAETVKDPVSRLTLAAASRDRLTRDSGRAPSGRSDDIIDNRLGGGSDYTVFLNRLGIPIADVSFQGRYDVYHSLYDTRSWLVRHGDPGFRYHVALVQFWGIAALRLANADLLPLDYEPYANQIADYASDVGRRAIARGGPFVGTGTVDLMADVRVAAGEMRRAAEQFNVRRQAALRSDDRVAIEILNDRLLAAERSLLDEDGLPGRSWYRHLVYAPAFTYAPEVLPGIAEAVDQDDATRAKAQAIRLAGALRRSAAALSTGAR